MRADAVSRHVAAFQGLLWLARLTLADPAPSSDEAQCFFTVSRNAADPFLAEHARAMHEEIVTARVLDLALLAQTTDPEDFLDPLAFCTQNRHLGRHHPQEEAVRALAAARPAGFFSEPGDDADDDACAALVLLYHLDRLEVATDRSLHDHLAACGPAALALPAELSEDELEERVYLLTHWVYALTDYGARPLCRSAAPGLHRALLSLLPEAIDSGNVETLGEVVECLRIFGHQGDEAEMDRALHFLLRRQNPDGSWGSARHDTQRHATWCAINALYDYRPALAGAWGPPATTSVLEPLVRGAGG